MAKTKSANDDSQGLPIIRKVVPLESSLTALKRSITIDVAGDSASIRRRNGAYKTKRGKNYSQEEAMALARNWVLQKDVFPKQKDAHFWKAVERRCHADGVQRSASSLKTLWSQFSRNTVRYIRARDSVLSQGISGCNEEQIRSKVMKLYMKLCEKLYPHSKSESGEYKFTEVAIFLAMQPRFTVHYKCDVSNGIYVGDEESKSDDYNDNIETIVKPIGDKGRDDALLVLEHVLEDEDNLRRESLIRMRKKRRVEGTATGESSGGGEVFTSAAPGERSEKAELMEIEVRQTSMYLDLQLVKALPTGAAREDVLRQVLEDRRMIREALEKFAEKREAN